MITKKRNNKNKQSTIYTAKPAVSFLFIWLTILFHQYAVLALNQDIQAEESQPTPVTTSSSPANELGSPLATSDLSQVCDCNPYGSNSTDCDSSSKQCFCKNENITGLKCDQCIGKHHDLSRGCPECDTCYQIVEIGVDHHRKALENLTDYVNRIENNPDSIKDEKFTKALFELMKRVNNMLMKAENAQGDELRLLNQFELLLNRLKRINSSALVVEKHLNNSRPNLDEADANITIAEDILERIKEEVKKANRIIDIDGMAALERARQRADKLGQQSRQMAEMAKESRQLADQHENDADKIRDLTIQALNYSTLAYELVKNATAVQEANARNIHQIKQQIEKAVELLNKTKALSLKASAEAKRSYEEALALYTLINSLQVSRSDIPKLRALAEELIRNAKRLKAEIEEFIERHAGLLNSTQFKLGEMRALLAEAMRQQQITEAQLADIDKTIFKAKSAIKQAEKILKEAQDTLAILKRFDQMVEESRKEAMEALKKIPAIRKTIKDAEDKAKDAAAKLDKALADATEARDIAQQAFGLANETSTDVKKIRAGAQELKQQLAILRGQIEKLSEGMNATAGNMDQLEKVAQNDGEMALLMLERANQAALSAKNATETAKNLLNIVNPLLKSIDSIGGIDVNKLAQLEDELEKLKQKLQESDLGRLINELLEQKEIQLKLMQEYQDLIEWLKKEVANIKDIRDSLPDKCFRRLRLEPPLDNRRKK